jgi:hypothetical protein
MVSFEPGLKRQSSATTAFTARIFSVRSVTVNDA